MQPRVPEQDPQHEDSGLEAPSGATRRPPPSLHLSAVCGEVMLALPSSPGSESPPPPRPVSCFSQNQNSGSKGAEGPSQPQLEPQQPLSGNVSGVWIGVEGWAKVLGSPRREAIPLLTRTPDSAYWAQ